MAEIVVAPMVSMVIKTLSPVILEQAGKIWGGDIESDLNEMRDTLSRVHVSIEARELNPERGGVAAREWMSRLKDALYDAQDLLEDFELHYFCRPEINDGWFRRRGKEVRRFLSSDNSQIFLFKTRPKIKEVVKRIKNLTTNLLLEPTNGVVVANTHLNELSYGFVEESDIVGREEEENDLVEKLIGLVDEPRLSVIPIVGMGGLGKTTLAKKVFNNQRVEQHFEPRIWLAVTDLGFEASKIGKAIVKATEEAGFQAVTTQSWPAGLRKSIEAKRYLLVLDDVWNETPQNWEEVKDLLKFGAQGSCVMVTTRSETVASVLTGTSTDHKFMLKVLSEDQCWELFSRRAFRIGVEPPVRLVRIGKDIVRKCGGLPLAAKALGSLMPSLMMSESRWLSVLNSEIWDRDVEHSQILPALMLSYYHLPSDIKQCFALCSLFRKGQEMEKETLIRLWVANGYMVSQSTDQMLSGNNAFTLLQERSFFQEVKVEDGWYKGRYTDSFTCSITTFKMHDLIHDVARYVSRTECCTLDQYRHSPSTSIPNIKARHLLVDYKANPREIGTSSQNRTMRTLLFNTSSSAAPSHPLLKWSNTINLRVLILHNMGFAEFPTEICELRHLRYLDLSCNNFPSIPEAFCRLSYMQILDLSYCRCLIGLPKCIRHMVSLMHLYLKGCTSLRCMSAGMGQLNQLRTLTKYVVGALVGSATLIELVELNLQDMLELCNLVSVIPNAQQYVSSNILDTKENLKKLVLNWGISDSGTYLLQTKESNTSLLDGTKTEENKSVMVLEALRPHQNLTHLEIIDYQGNDFPRLLMEDLAHFSSLVEVILKNCNGSDHLPQLGQLPHLETLVIKNMKSVKQILCGGVAFPSLKKVMLLGMPNLEEWYLINSAEGQAFPHVTDVMVVECPKLTSMPVLPSTLYLTISYCPLLRTSQEFFRLMSSLQKLLLKSCDHVILQLEKEDDPPLGSLTSLVIVGCQERMFSSASVGMWKRFSSLKYLRIDECDGLVILPVDILQCLSSLKELHIHGCHYLVGSSFEEPGLEFGDLPSLEVVDISWCTLFPRFLPQGLSGLKSLKEMEISNNDGLTELPDFPVSLRELRIKACRNLKSLPVRLGQLPELESLDLWSLKKVDTLADGSYQALNRLHIHRCKVLVTFPPGLLNRFPEVEDLEISKSPALLELFHPGGEYWPYIEGLPNIDMRDDSDGDKLITMLFMVNIN